MSEEATTVSVKILDKEDQVSCPAEEVDALSRSARYLDEQMRSIRESGKIFGMDRIAVMAALNIANEFINSSKSLESTHGVVSQKVTELTERVGRALSEQKQLNL